MSLRSVRGGLQATSPILWSSRAVRRLAEDIPAAISRIEQTLRARAIERTFAGSEYVVWGQYLDEMHYSEEQWGPYATSAAVLVLSISHNVTHTGVAPSSDLLVARGAASLPSDVTQPPPLLADKHTRHPGTLDNVLKLAYAAEALALEATDVPQGSEPPLVGQLLEMSVDGCNWTTRPAAAPFRPDRLYPTAYVTWALSPYAAARGSATWQAARLYLADEVLNDPRMAPSKVALIALALHLPDEQDKLRPERVGQALQTCETRLIEWITARRAIDLDRPAFFGFAFGEKTGYNFLQPELLGALFLMRRNNPPQGRSFVLRVARSLCENIRAHGGFLNQDDVMLTTAQVWAVRLLAELKMVAGSQGGTSRLLPPLDMTLTFGSPGHRLAGAAVVAFLALGVALLTAASLLAAIGAWALAVLMIPFAYLLTPRN